MCGTVSFDLVRSSGPVSVKQIIKVTSVSTYRRNPAQPFLGAPGLWNAAARKTWWFRKPVPPNRVRGGARKIHIIFLSSLRRFIGGGIIMECYPTRATRAEELRFDNVLCG